MSSPASLGPVHWEEAWISHPLEDGLSSAAHMWDGSRFGNHELHSHPGFAMGGLEQTSLSFNRLIGDRDKNTTAQARSECQVIRTVGSWWGIGAQPMPLPRLPWGSQPPGLCLCTCRLNLPSLSDPTSVGTRDCELSEKAGSRRPAHGGVATSRMSG